MIVYLTNMCRDRPNVVAKGMLYDVEGFRLMTADRFTLLHCQLGKWTDQGTKIGRQCSPSYFVLCKQARQMPSRSIFVTCLNGRRPWITKVQSVECSLWNVDFWAMVPWAVCFVLANKVRRIKLSRWY